MAIQKLVTNQCLALNSRGSRCLTVAQFGECKVDACWTIGSAYGEGFKNASAVGCAASAQTLFDACKSNQKDKKGNIVERVGGIIVPVKCKMLLESDGYRLQFSHK
jgi:hypothetical protein